MTTTPGVSESCRGGRHRHIFGGALAVMLAVAVAWCARPVTALSPTVVISQVYGGGGNSGAPYTNDFIELFNRGSVAASLSGWSVQYASATGTGNFGASASQLTVLPDVILAPGQYFLIQEAGGATGAPLPGADLVAATAINMSASAGKVALVASTTSLGCNGGSTGCSPIQLAQIVDLVGYGTANFFEGAAAPALDNATAAGRAAGGCTETDHNASDFSAAAPAPRTSAAPLAPCGIVSDAAPTITATTPAEGATNVALSTSITVAFSEPVDIAAGAVVVSCPIGTPLASSAAASGVTAVVLTPGSPLPAGTTCVVDVNPAGVVDTDAIDPPDGLAGPATVSFATAASGPVCAQPYTRIYDIQGSGAVAAVTGTVTTQGVVVGDYEGPSPAQRGFFIQDPDGDGDAATSDGLFVFNGNNDSVSLGDLVRVTGTAGEFQDQTQVGAHVNGVVTCGTGSAAPVDVELPVPTSTHLERYEGMLVRLPQTLAVTEHFQLGRFGQVVVSANGRLVQPTEVAMPGPAALAVQATNALNRLIVDDEAQGQNPDPIRFGRNGAPLSAINPLRGGDTATGIVGVMTYTWAGNAASGNAYRVRPFGALGGTARFEATNPRPGAAPGGVGSLRIASMNLLNFFNTFDGLPDTVDNCTFGVGGAAADCRGADTQVEFDRQWPKTVAAILGSGADVIGVIEIENDGYRAGSALQFLVDRLNDATAPGSYTFIDADAAIGAVNALGTDAIKVGIVYKPESVAPVGDTASLDTVSFVNGGDSGPRNRAALAQAFRDVATGARFIVSVNHFKSKGSACDAPDAGDGQGNCNTVRTAAAADLANWLATNPTGIADPDVLILGDLNAYSMEDPVTTLAGAGYRNLVDTAGAFSYAFDGQWGSLDHALGSASLAAQVTGATVWTINADEASVLDYNTDFKSACQIGPPQPCTDPIANPSLYAADEFRIADHNPVLIDLELVAPVPVRAVVRGGGWLVLGGDSAGVKAGDEGSRLGLLLAARIGRVGSGPTGSVALLVRHTEADGEHRYLVTAPTVSSLTGDTANGRALVTARALIWDITAPWPRLVDINAVVRVTLEDHGRPGAGTDRIGVTVTNRGGTLWFSSSWNGSATVNQTLDGGNLLVR